MYIRRVTFYRSGSLCIKLFLLALFLFSLQMPLFAEESVLPGHNASDTLVSHTGYTLCYSEEYEQAKWVGYELTREEILGDTERTDDFRKDPKVASETASVDDYRYSGYDRGHLAPAADFSWSEEAMSDTFYLSNMSPQKPGFNRGIWRSLESKVREWVVRDEALLVVTGPVLGKKSSRGGRYETVGENEVAVPRAYYKVLLDIGEPERKGIGFILPHESCSKPLSTYAVSIDEVEKATGIDFYYSVEETLEKRLESDVDKSLWFDGEHYEARKHNVRAGETDETTTEKTQEAPAKYWINSSSGTRHNSDCRYYGDTEEGYYSDEKVGESCGICGG